MKESQRKSWSQEKEGETGKRGNREEERLKEKERKTGSLFPPQFHVNNRTPHSSSFFFPSFFSFHCALKLITTKLDLKAPNLLSAYEGIYIKLAPNYCYSLIKVTEHIFFHFPGNQG